MRFPIRIVLTTAVVCLAVGLMAFKFRQYLLDPWTRDGQVRANVVKITPRVSGPIVALPIKDNQYVHKGDLLFVIDPRTFQAAFDKASANLDQTRNQIDNLTQQVKSATASRQQCEIAIRKASFAVTSAKAHFDEASKDLGRNESLVARDTIARRDYDLSKETSIKAQSDFNQSQAQLESAISAQIKAESDLASSKALLGAPGEDNPLLRQAMAQWEEAKLNLEFSKVKAPVDGYVTNLSLRLGTQAVANQPLLALVDADSFWIAGYFRETFIGGIAAGDKAVVTLMTYPDAKIEGEVESIGQGVAQQDGATGEDLLPTINPTFEWIRLAQRIPVRIHILRKPENVVLRVGTTASVLVMTKTH